MKVAVFGCGMIAQEHLRSIRQCPTVELVGIADPNEQALATTSEKWGAPRRFTDPAELLRETRPDVVHVATPPETHYTLVKLALEAGCHVYAEKPLTLHAPETEELIALAERRQRQLCVGYMHLFDRVLLEAQRLVREGAIGQLCGIESYYGFDLGTSLGRYFNQAYTHWAYKLPGGLFQNGLDHPLSVIMPFMPEPKTVMAAAADVGVLPKGIPGELRILLGNDNLLASVTLSEAASPRFHYLNLLGSEGTLQVDLQNKRLMRWGHKHGIPHFVTRFWMNVSQGLKVLGGTAATVLDVAAGRFTPYEGMQCLTREFYRAIETGAPCPMPPAYAASIMRVMDRVWEQIPRPQPVAAAAPVPATRPRARTVLVTGGTGFIGRRVVQALLEEGSQNVRVLARNLEKAQPLADLGAEVVVGNLFDDASLKEAVAGVDSVYHLGATMTGQWADYHQGTIKGTERLVDACQAAGVRRLVFASTIAVYGTPALKAGQRIDEDTPWAASGQTHYMRSKIEAERIVLDRVRNAGLQATILRLGLVYGRERGHRVSRIGYPVGDRLFIKVGLNNHRLPSVHVDDAVAALLLAGRSERAVGRTYNVVDDQGFTQLGFLRSVGKYRGRRIRVVFFPYGVLGLVGGLARRFEASNGIARRVSGLTSEFHLNSCTRALAYDNSRIKQELGWTPAPDVEARLKATFAPAASGAMPAPLAVGVPARRSA